MHVDRYVMSYFIIMQRSVSDEALVAAPILLITAGIIIIGVGILGCCGLSKRNKLLLGVVSSSFVSSQESYVLPLN